MNKLSFKILLLSLFSMYLFSSGQIAIARPIAVVMDDSGSMKGKYQTSLFALQSLTSMVSPDDELFIVKMSHINKPYRTNKTQRDFDVIRGWGIGDNTPFDSVNKALEILVKHTKPQEEAILLIITDGDFSGEPATGVSAIRLFKNYQSQFKGKNLRAFFISIQTQDNAHIRSALLKTFNGNPDEGDIFIDTNKNMLATMSKVYASILGVKDDHGQSLDFNNQSVFFQAPFPVVEIVAISSSANNTLPIVNNYPNSKKGTLVQYQYRMQQTDNITRRKLYGNTTSMKPWPPLEAGKEYQIDFNQPINNKETQVLLKTEVSVDWKLYDASGNELHAVNGVYKVGLNQQIIVNAWVESADSAGQKYKVNLTTLPKKMTIALRSDGGQGVKSQTMTAVPTDPLLVTGHLKFSTPGKQLVSVAARYPGFIDTRAKDIEIEIEKVQPAQLLIEYQDSSICPQCRPDHVQLTYVDKADYQPVMDLMISATSIGKGNVTVDLSLDNPLPDGVQIVMPDGKVLDRNHSVAQLLIELNDKKPKRLSLQYNKDYQLQSAVSVKLLLTAQSPWQGQSEIILNLVPDTHDLRIHSAGSTIDPSGQTPFELMLSSLDSQEGMYFKLDGLVTEQIDLEHLSIQSDNLRSKYEINIEKNNLIAVSPVYWWCDCFTATGEQSFTLVYNNPLTNQHALVSSKVNITPTPWVVRCWQEILTAIALLMVLAKIICIIKTHRFAKASYVEIGNIQRTQLINDVEYLHHKSWFWCGFWPGCKSEVVSIDGLNLRARKNGLELLPGAYGNLMNKDGIDLVTNDFKNNGERPIRLFWNDELNDGQTVYKFIKG